MRTKIALAALTAVAVGVLGAGSASASISNTGGGTPDVGDPWTLIGTMTAVGAGTSTCDVAVALEVTDDPGTGDGQTSDVVDLVTLGCTTASLILDISYVAQDEPLEIDASGTVVSGSIVADVLTATPGNCRYRVDFHDRNAPDTWSGSWSNVTSELTVNPNSGGTPVPNAFLVQTNSGTCAPAAVLSGEFVGTDDTTGNPIQID